MKNHALLVLFSSLAIACGATEQIGPAPAPVPADPAPTEPTPAPPEATPPLDHGKPSDTYPAFTPAMGQLVNNGGGVLKQPVIVTITFPGEPHVDDFETLGDKVGAGAYWKAIVSEYGSGPAVSGSENHIRMQDALPASITDKQLATFVSDNLSKAEGAWPTPATGDPVYILYLPKTTDLVLGKSSACRQGVGGYHESVKVNGKNVAYAIIPQCQGFDEITLSASHELAEAAVDPYPNARPAWVGFQDENLAWEFFQQFQSENGDACEFYRDSALRPNESDVGFTVQRQWSNASALAGHDPCVPAFPGATYFNVTPLQQEDIDVDLSSMGGSTATTKGYKIPVGKTRTIPLGFYSDGPLSKWTVRAVAGGIAGGSRGSDVDLNLDVNEGQNGEKTYLTITVNSAGRSGTELVTVVSTRGSTTHYMPILIGSPE